MCHRYLVRPGRHAHWSAVTGYRTKMNVRTCRLFSIMPLTLMPGSTWQCSTSIRSRYHYTTRKTMEADKGKPMQRHTFSFLWGIAGRGSEIMVECRYGLHDNIINGHAPYVTRWLHAKSVLRSRSRLELCVYRAEELLNKFVSEEAGSIERSVACFEAWRLTLHML